MVSVSRLDIGVLMIMFEFWESIQTQLIEPNLNLRYVPTFQVSDFCTGLLALEDLFLFQGSVVVPNPDQMEGPIRLEVETQATENYEWIKFCSVDLRSPCFTTNKTLECCSQMTKLGVYDVNISGVAMTLFSMATIRMLWMRLIPKMAMSRFPLIYGPPSINVSVGSILHKIELDERCELTLIKSKSGITFCVGYLELPVLSLYLNEQLDQVPGDDNCVRGVFEVIQEVPRHLRFSYQDGCGRSAEFRCHLNYNIPCITGDCSKMPSGRYAPCPPECLTGVFYHCYRGITYTEMCPYFWVKNEFGFTVKVVGIFESSAGTCVVNSSHCPRSELPCIGADCTGLLDGTYAACPPNCALGWYYKCELGIVSKLRCQYGWYSDLSGQAYEARMIYDPVLGLCRRYAIYCSEYGPVIFKQSVGSTLNYVQVQILLISILTFELL